MPTDFSYPVFALLLLLNGIGSRPVLGAEHDGDHELRCPADQRGAASGMRATFQNSGMVLSIGVFFSLMVVGLSPTRCRAR